jgi:hypothetical protein
MKEKGAGTRYSTCPEAEKGRNSKRKAAHRKGVKLLGSNLGCLGVLCGKENRGELVPGFTN